MAEQVALTWDRSGDKLLALLLPTTLLDRPSKQRLRRPPRLQEIVTADDWRRLISERWRELALWRETDLASWLNGLIRDRVTVRTDAPRRPEAPDAALPTPSATAQAMFYIGR